MKIFLVILIIICLCFVILLLRLNTKDEDNTNSTSFDIFSDEFIDIIDDEHPKKEYKKDELD